LGFILKLDIQTLDDVNITGVTQLSSELVSKRLPVLLHADDCKWVRQPDGCINFWQGERYELLKGVTLIRGGGRFPGGTMLHWAAGAEGKGVVCSADIAMVNLDRKSFALCVAFRTISPFPRKRSVPSGRR